MNTTQPEAMRLACELELGTFAPNVLQNEAALRQNAAAELRRQHARITELEDACCTNLENYEFQRSKADRATATVYQFHYAMKDAGWHPGRTDDDLTQIIRAKGGELASATRHITELESQLAAIGAGGVSALMRAAKEQQAGWEAIETAPKDGREVLGYTAEVGALVLYWDTMCSETDRWSDGMSMHNWAPTHWQPMPPPPSSTQREVGNG